jgi:hypothetical protein
MPVRLGAGGAIHRRVRLGRLARCRMAWYHLADRTRANTTARWVAGWSVGTGSSKIRRESAAT